MKQNVAGDPADILAVDPAEQGPPFMLGAELIIARGCAAAGGAEPHLDGNGISVKSYREIREAFMTKLKAVFGQSLQTDPSSPDGHLFDLIGYAYDEVKGALQGAIANLDASSAEGVFLDNIARLMGLTRNLDEKDDELRARLLEADNKGLATFEGMLTYLRDNIHSSVTMAENPEPSENSDHIPGHSFAVYIPEDVYAELEEKETQGEIASADGYIAQKIWECKPAGIRAYGNREGTAKDSSGMSHDIKFFVITFLIFYFIILIYDTAYFMRVEKKIRNNA